MIPPNCPFCSLSPDRVRWQNESFIAFTDGFPVSEDHTLVIPREHVQSIFNLSDGEQVALWSFVAMVRSKLENEIGLNAFNIGINDGAAAGQTVPHAHVHIIPRRDGDVDDPRGGIRWVIPSKAKYW